MRGNGGRTSRIRNGSIQFRCGAAGDDQRLATRHKLQPLDLDVEPQQPLANQGKPELDSSRLQRGPEVGRKRSHANGRDRDSPQPKRVISWSCRQCRASMAPSLDAPQRARFSCDVRPIEVSVKSADADEPRLLPRSRGSGQIQRSPRDPSTYGHRCRETHFESRCESDASAVLVIRDCPPYRHRAVAPLCCDPQFPACRQVPCRLERSRPCARPSSRS